MLWDEMTQQQRDQKRKEIAKRRWDYTRNEAKWDLLCNALRHFDKNFDRKAIIEALLCSYSCLDLYEIVQYLNELFEHRQQDPNRVADDPIQWIGNDEHVYQFDEWGLIP
jgi:hypothetical protein